MWGGLPWPLHGQLEHAAITCCEVFSGCLETLSKWHGMACLHDAHNIRGASAPLFYRHHGTDACCFSDGQAATAMDGHPVRPPIVLRS